MGNQEQHVQRIDDYLKEQADKADTGLTRNIKLKVGYKRLEVYRFPTNLLRYRLENTRFEVEKYAYEKKHKEIDQDTDEGKNAVIGLLLYEPETTSLTTDAKKLITDIEQHGQLEPGVITWDGFVLNGNRRLASLDYLYRKNKNIQYQYFTAVRLPPTADKEDFFLVEADLQWAEDLKLDYDALAKYKMLEHAIDFNKSVEFIAKLTRKPVKLIKAEIEELKFIKDYLKTTDDPKDFSKLDRQTEIVTEAAIMTTYFSRNKVSHKIVSSYKERIFTFININIKMPSTITYQDIRAINKAFRRNDTDALQIYQKIKISDSQETVKHLLEEASTVLAEHKKEQKPDKMAHQISKIAGRLYRESKKRKLSKSTLKLVKETLLLLQKIAKQN